jgi:hypothetical protein
VEKRKVGDTPTVSYRLRRADLQALRWGISKIKTWRPGGLDRCADADRVQLKTSRDETRVGRLGRPGSYTNTHSMWIRI